jgi:hypothetical protein
MDFLSNVPEPAALGDLVITQGTLWFGNFLAFVLLTFLMLVFAMRARLGIVYLIIAMYIAYGLYTVFPYTHFLVNFTDMPAIKAVTSVLLFMLFTFFPYRFIDRLAGGGVGIMTFFTNVMLSVLAAGFILALCYHLFQINQVFTFSAPIDQLFAPEGYFFYWFMAPLIGVYLLVH